jgi:hypothetical protein
MRIHNIKLLKLYMFLLHLFARKYKVKAVLDACNVYYAQGLKVFGRYHRHSLFLMNEMKSLLG